MKDGKVLVFYSHNWSKKCPHKNHKKGYNMYNVCPVRLETTDLVENINVQSRF